MDLESSDGKLLNLDDSHCFLCRPEEWRVLFSGRDSRILVGTGPLCEGYIILAPNEHIQTVSELTGRCANEFSILSEIIKRAFFRQYGPGFTAYEHGRIGVCDPLEKPSCYHAHRVFIPIKTDVYKSVASQFSSVSSIDTFDSLSRISGNDYLYYETGFLGRIEHCVALLSPKNELPTQYFRRVFTDLLGQKNNWNWAFDVDLPQMINTLSRLKTEFIGLGFLGNFDIEKCTSPNMRLECNLFIDGLSRVGKTTVGSILSRMCQSNLIDTGLVFRKIALASLMKTSLPSVAEISRTLGPGSENDKLRKSEVTQMASEIAQDGEMRALYQRVVKNIIDMNPSNIVVGRDTWTFAQAKDKCILLFADKETRIRRSALEASWRGEQVDLSLLSKHISNSDKRDNPKLPPTGLQNLNVIDNGQRSIFATISDIAFLLGDTHEYRIPSN